MSSIGSSTGSYPVNNNTTMKNSTNNTTTTATDRGIMQKDDFLKLFLASLQNQDPLAPMETKDMMEQMTQLTLIEQITNMGKVVDSLKEAMAPSEENLIDKGVSFIGKEVTGKTLTGEEVAGRVDEVRIDEGNVSLIVNNKNVEIGAISRVADYSAYTKYQ